MPSTSSWRIALAYAGLQFFAASTATAQEISVDRTAAPALTAEDADVFFDGLIPYALKRGDIAGAVLVIVKDGKILFAKGYGYADLAKQEPVDPERTIFRLASTSKLFTWTAVMQLVGEGKIDLDRDINDYLDFKIPPKFGKPITMRNLMTHTAGFENGFAGILVPKPGELLPYRNYIVAHIPARIYPPGKIIAYSNYSAALAGYIVQRISGEPYTDYIANHILKPLGMTHSTFVQPIPPELAPDLATSYATASSGRPSRFDLLRHLGAGAGAASGTDMAHFMIAQLQDGRYGDAEILTPAMAELLHSTQSQMAPGMNGVDLGFWENNLNGLRIIGHGGDHLDFHSVLSLLLDKNIGLFVAFNSTGKDGAAPRLRGPLFQAFLDRYFPYTPPEEETVADPKPDAARVAGWYVLSARVYSAFRLVPVFEESEVIANSNGTIVTGSRRWREVGPLTYREIGGQAHLKFVTDSQGGIAYWVSDTGAAVGVMQRVHGLDQLPWLKVWVGATFAVWLLTVAIWIGGAMIRRHFSLILELPKTVARLRLASHIGALVLLAMVPMWNHVLSLYGENLESIIDPWLTAAYVLGVLAILGALAILADAALRVWRGPGGWLVRSGELVLGLSAIFALWTIFAFGLANFSFTY